MGIKLFGIVCDNCSMFGSYGKFDKDNNVELPEGWTVIVNGEIKQDIINLNIYFEHATILCNKCSRSLKLQKIKQIISKTN